MLLEVRLTVREVWEVIASMVVTKLQLRGSKAECLALLYHSSTLVSCYCCCCCCY